MNLRYAGLAAIGFLLVALYLFNRKDVELETQQFLPVQNISATGAQLPTIIRLKNSNLLSSTIKSIHEKFYLNGVLLGIIDNELNQGIPGLETTEFPAEIRFMGDDYRQALARDSANAKVTVEGSIKFQNLFTSGEIQVHQTNPFTLKP